MKQQEFRIGSHKIGTGQLLFIVEEGQANLGNFDKALNMVESIAQTGADAIEFQMARADDFYVKNSGGYEVYAKREFNDAQIKDLVAFTRDKGMEFIAVPLSHKLVDLLVKAGCSGFNINASDLTNPDIIDAVTATGVSFFLSLPLASEEEIDWAVNRITHRCSSMYGLMHGQHTMASGESGVHVEHTFLGYIETLKKRYQVPVGFIDHTSLIWMPACAVAAGADVVSKHYALSRSEKGPDWQVCLEPVEMKEAVQYAKKMWESVQVKVKKLAPGEYLDRSKMRRSIVAARRLDPGRIIEREDIVFKRPGLGLCPSKFEAVIGKTVMRVIQVDEYINENNVNVEET